MPVDDAIALILETISQLSFSISSSQIDSMIVDGSKFTEQSTYSDTTHFDFLHSIAGIQSLCRCLCRIGRKNKSIGTGFKGPFDVLSSKDKNNQLYVDAKNSVTELSDALKRLTSVVNELGKSLK